MFLKSEAFASSLSHPSGSHTLAAYCADHGLEYSDLGTPVPVETFHSYGRWYQQRLVPDVIVGHVSCIRRDHGAFHLELSSGERLRSASVVLACGNLAFAYVPSRLRTLPAGLVSHSGDHHDLTRFEGREVTVVGAGQSALETAALLHESGTQVRVVVRRSQVVWHSPPIQGGRSLRQRLRRPLSGLGAGWRLWCYATMPGAFHVLPAAMRSSVVRSALGPAGAWWLRGRIEDQVPVLLGTRLTAAEPASDGLVLDLLAGDTRTQVYTEHLIAATGYRPRVAALPALDAALRRQVRETDGQPVLSASLETTVPGLYLAGLAATHAFGPSQRFILGADFAARRITRGVIARSR
jgi:thioredoxin reductase